MISISELRFFNECFIFISGFSLGIILLGLGLLDERFKKMKLIRRIPLLFLFSLGWHIVFPVPAFFIAYILDLFINITK